MSASGRGAPEPRIAIDRAFADPAEAFHCSVCARHRWAGPSLSALEETIYSRQRHPGGPMTIVLDHTIVPARDKEESARFFARIFGLAYEGPQSHFAPVRVNETLTLDFDTDENFQAHHYAFKMSG